MRTREEVLQYGLSFAIEIIISFIFMHSLKEFEHIVAENEPMWQLLILC